MNQLYERRRLLLCVLQKRFPILYFGDFETLLASKLDLSFKQPDIHAITLSSDILTKFEAMMNSDSDVITFAIEFDENNLNITDEFQAVNIVIQNIGNFSANLNITDKISEFSEIPSQALQFENGVTITEKLNNLTQQIIYGFSLNQNMQVSTTASIALGSPLLLQLTVFSILSMSADADVQLDIMIPMEIRLGVAQLHIRSSFEPNVFETQICNILTKKFSEMGVSVQFPMWCTQITDIGKYTVDTILYTQTNLPSVVVNTVEINKVISNTLHTENMFPVNVLDIIRLNVNTLETLNMFIPDCMSNVNSLILEQTIRQIVYFISTQQLLATLVSNIEVNTKKTIINSILSITTDFINMLDVSLNITNKINLFSEQEILLATSDSYLDYFANRTLKSLDEFNLNLFKFKI